MKTYLEFSNNGEIIEHKLNNKNFNKENYTDFKYIKKIIYNKYNFILLYNVFDNNINSIKNITVLPFYENCIYGNFLLFSSVNKDCNEQSNNIILKSLNEVKFLKLINIIDKPIEDYSSDDFNLSE